MLGGVEVDHVVGDVPARLVDLLRDVDAGAREAVGDLGQHPGDVLVDDREADDALVALRHAGVGEVDGIADGAVFDVLADRVGRHGGGLVLGLLRGRAQMRKYDAAFVVPQQVVGEIGDVLSGAGIEKLLHGFGIDEFAASEIEQDSILFEVRNHVGTNDAVGSALFRRSLDVGDVDADVIGIGDGGRDRIGQRDVAGQRQGVLHTETGVVALSQSIVDRERVWW